jgi:tetratricopeptide (TPR) repeat protein
MRSSCSKYLNALQEERPVIPKTLNEAQAILDNPKLMNVFDSVSMGEVAADDFYLSYDDWSALSTKDGAEAYIWADDGSAGWGGYKAAFHANVVLDALSDIPAMTKNLLEWNRTYGAALFYRAYDFFAITQLFTLPYEPAKADSAPGIPLPLTADTNSDSVRANLHQTYVRILEDFRFAAAMLPAKESCPTRPTKAAAFAALARVYLTLSEYSKAGLYADSCLQLYDRLLDYHDLSPGAVAPFRKFNQEVIFHSTGNSAALAADCCKVDSQLYRSYAAIDLRKKAFFRTNEDGSVAFKGSYSGVNGATQFNGITVPEMYLIKAECAARLGYIQEALSVLNRFMAKRYYYESFASVQIYEQEQLLRFILAERRRELLFRGLRWMDLRRLNTEGMFKRTIIRVLNDKIYTLEPGDLRYAFLIPEDVVMLTGMKQNERKSFSCQ